MKTANNIQQFIINNHEVMTKLEMAEILDVPLIRVGANYGILERRGIISIEEIKTNVETSISKLAKLNAKLSKKIEEKIKGDTYKNKTGIKKGECRTKITEYFKNAVGVIPCLPHEKCEMEIKINAVNKNVSFLAIDNNPLIVSKGKKTTKENNLPIKWKVGDMGKELIYGESENTYGGLNFDFCGYFSTNSNIVKYSIHNNLMIVGGYMCLTFAVDARQNFGIHGKVKGLGKTIVDSEYDNRTDNLRGIETFINRFIIGERDYDIVEVFPYRDKTTNMCLMIIRRNG